MDKPLMGKLAVVTGAGQELGALLHSFARSGADLVMRAQSRTVR